MNSLNPGLKHPLLKKFKRSSYVRVKKNLNIYKLLNFADNENVYGPSPKVYSAIKRNLSSITSYPDGESYILKNTIAQFFKLPSETITITSGVIETLRFLHTIFKQNSCHVILPKNSFIQYKVAAVLANNSYSEAPILKTAASQKKILSLINKNTKYIFISNPDNPSGDTISHNLLVNFLNKIPKSVLVILDETYIEYSKNVHVKSCIYLTEKYKNLVVLKSFSKIYGLPGLRVGFAVTHNPLINKYLSLAMPPFNVSSIAQIAACAAIKDQKYLKKIVEKNHTEKIWLTQKLKELNLRVYHSETNYLLIGFSKHNSKTLFDKLLLKGILVKDLSNYGFSNHHRITILKRAENKKLVESYKELI